MKDSNQSVHIPCRRLRLSVKAKVLRGILGETPLEAARHLVLFLFAFGFTIASISAEAQSLLGTVPTGSTPIAVDINSATNKIYVANQNSNDVTVIDGTTNSTVTVSVGSTPQAVAVDPAVNKIYVANRNGDTVTVIDGTTNSTLSVGVGSHPRAVAANPVTNKIYVSNYNGNTVTIIDATTNSTSTVTVGRYPEALAINQVTNKIYVVNCGSGSVTVIDGTTNSTSTVGVGDYPQALAINPRTNMVYVANYASNNVTVIDGATNSSTTIDVGLGPSAVAVNSVANQIYVANRLGGSVTVIDGVTLSVNTVAAGSNPSAVENTVYVLNSADNTVSVIGEGAPGALQFIPATPCRVADTRLPNGPFGGPPIPTGGYRNFAVPQSTCGIPASATAYSLNVTVVPHGGLGFLTLWPTGEDRPGVSTMNSLDGRIKATAAIVPAGSNGAVSVYASSTTDVVLDINGYFVPTPDPSALAFYPLKPCRVADTRWAAGPLGGPYLQGGAAPRELPVLSAVSCNIPTSARAYSLNFTAAPRGVPLWVLSTWPAGQSQPKTSTLNAPTGTITANAVIVPAGSNGGIDVWVSDSTDLVIDINGYFAPAALGGLSLYPTNPCRVLDTRKTIGLFSGLLVANVAGSPCGVSTRAQAFVLNATVVPNGPLWVLTLWPDGQRQPSASTLNALDGIVTSNLAIVPTTNGSIDAYATGSTALILDISSYFAP